MLNTETTRKQDYTGSASILFLAFELGNSTWNLAFSIGLGQKARKRSIRARDLRELSKEVLLAKQKFGLPETTPVTSCYEAGRDGFWLDRYLEKTGVKNHVVDSSSIEVNRKARRAKTDELDVESLLRLLMRYHNGERKVWNVLRVPSPKEEDDRQLHRELSTLKKERTRTINRIKGLLINQGVRLKRMDLSDKALDAIRLWDGSSLQGGLKRRLMRQWEQLVFLKKQIQTLEGERRSTLKGSKEKAVEQMRQLATLRSIGSNRAWLLVREFYGWRDFKNRRQVGSLSGLVPSPYNSGDSKREQGISKAGNRHVRGAAVELAWSWVRFQPESKLTRWFIARFHSGGKRARKIGIVALARRLLIELWRFLKTGALPEGARLKAEALAQ